MTLTLQTLANSMNEYALGSWVRMGTGAGHGTLSVSYRHNFLALLYLSKKIRLDVSCESFALQSAVLFSLKNNENIIQDCRLLQL